MQQPPPRRTFHVRDYGAHPDSGIDAGPGIRAAIAAAIGPGEPAEVVLDEGVYRVGPGPAGGYAVSVEGARDLVLRGRGTPTELVITDPTLGGIRLSNCDRVSVVGLAIDYDPAPYSQGTIAAVDEDGDTFDLVVDEGYIEPNHDAFAEARAAWGMLIRPGEEGRPTQYGPTAIPAVAQRRLADRTWRLLIGGPPTGYPEPLRTSRMKAGDRYVHMARNYAAAVGVDHSDNVTLEAIALYASPGLAFCPYLCGKVAIRDCHIKPRPDSGRLLSTNADGVHCRGSRQGIEIEGCSFEGMSDDGINIHASPIPVLEVVSPTEVIVQKFHYTLRAGDRLEVMDSTESRVRGVAVAEAVEDLADRWAYRVKFDRPVEGIRGGSSFQDADNLYNLSECATGSTVRGCHFKSFRGRGVLLSCVGCVVSGNTFDVTEGWGVVLFHEATRWGEGPLARDITIEGNTFNGRGGYQAAVYVYPGKRDGTPSEAREVRRLLIRRNRFIDLGVPAVDLHGCRDVRVIDNVVDTSEGAPRPRPSYASMIVDNCAGVRIEGLHVRDTDARHVAAVVITPSTDPGEGGVRVSDLTAELAPTSADVEDRRDPADG